ncbi:hypothetical protein SAMN05444167_0968 [Terriglobus roseus]|uniref:Uncharacterized protein n=1 Tax=Terriglobus roseus TaxID=392734 RepID=A0A1G7H8S0_9BACT|nr:hypothetical protein SAMN05444167_0968 [Terriglobus roseus]
MSEGRNGEVHGKRLPDVTYELSAFSDGHQVAHPFIHRDGSPLIRERALYATSSELLSAYETPDGTLVCSMTDIDRFIDAVGMRRIDTNPDKQ